MDNHEWLYRIKSARRKRRLVKTDRDKQLIQLSKQRDELSLQRRLIPLVPLEQPYQRGWKRFFVLREDIKRSPKASFYEALLPKINTTEYHHEKSFKRKKRRKKRYGFEVRKQLLREFDLYWWNSPRTNLSDREKTCFTRAETYSIKTRRAEVKYVFTEPWRYVLKVVPNMITHRKPLDADMEKEIAWIDNHFERYDLWPRINRLTRGRSYRSRDYYGDPAKYTNKLKNMPRYADKEAYLELET